MILNRLIRYLRIKQQHGYIITTTLTELSPKFLKSPNFHQNHHRFTPKRFYSTTIHTHHHHYHHQSSPSLISIISSPAPSPSLSPLSSSSSSSSSSHSTLLLTTTTLLIPTLFFFLTFNKAPNTNRLRLMVPLWPWETDELIRISKRQVTRLPTITDQQDPRLQLIDHVINRLWKCGVKSMEYDQEEEEEVSGIGNNKITNHGNKWNDESSSYKKQQQHLHHHHQKPKVHLIYDDEILDGVSYASSDITVTTCWLRFVDYDEELLASILAHELAHIMQNHAIEFYSIWSLTSFLGFFANTFNRLFSFVSSNNNNNINGSNNNGNGNSNDYIKRYLEKHSQELEKEADLLGQQIMARSGYNPMKAVELWERMKELDEMNDNKHNCRVDASESVDQKGEDNVNPLLSFKHHPPKSQRIKYLKENLINVQHFYDRIIQENNNKYERDLKYKSFDKDLSLRRVELTALAIFGEKKIAY